VRDEAELRHEKGGAVGGVQRLSQSFVVFRLKAANVGPRMPTALAALQLSALALFEARFRHRVPTRLAGGAGHVLTATLLSARLAQWARRRPSGPATIGQEGQRRGV
jgi:hypothetical protein